MPVNGILFEAVIRRHIKATAEPPHRIRSRFFSNKETHVGVAGRNVRVLGVDHQRHAQRLKAATGQLGTVRGGRGGHGVAVDMGEVDARLLEHPALAQHAAASAAAARPLPAVFGKLGFAIGLRQLATDVILKVEQKLFYLGDIRCVHKKIL